MLADLIHEFTAKGLTSFSVADIEKLKDSSPVAIKAALRRLQRKGEITMPYRGFYVIVPPEYRALACLPAEQLVPDLMNHLGEMYYAGLLSAAEYHGAAHHRPQVFQVMVSKSRRPVACGKVRVEFVFRKNADKIPTQQRNTPAGAIKIATPEATAFDLIGYARHCGGMDNVATILSELLEKLDAGRLVKAAEFSPIAWVQRLGYLLNVTGGQAKSEGLLEYIRDKNPPRTPLMPTLSIKGSKTDSRWRVFVNTHVEAEV